MTLIVECLKVGFIEGMATLSERGDVVDVECPVGYVAENLRLQR